MNEKLEAQAKHLDQIATELEQAVAHAKTAAAHFRSGEVPRGCAHTLAVEGHVHEAVMHIEQIAKAHRLAARPHNMTSDSRANTSIETFLQSFHKMHPGCTPASFLNGFTKEGMTSYDVALSVLPAKPEAPITVADLACGDGVLLQKIIKRTPNLVTLIGLDMSVGELEAAHARLGKLPVKLIEAKAQAIPLPDQSVDFVLCHMAFMLMDDVEKVVSEVLRILKSGGVFCAIVGGKYEKTPAMEAFLSLLDEALKGEDKSWLSNLGDRRTRSEEGLRSLFNGSEFLQPVTVSDFTINFHEKPVDLMDFFMLMYDVGVLSHERQSLLGRALAERLNLLTNEAGKLAHSMGLRQVICQKSAPKL